MLYAKEKNIDRSSKSIRLKSVAGELSVPELVHDFDAHVDVEVVGFLVPNRHDPLDGRESLVGGIGGDGGEHEPPHPQFPVAGPEVEALEEDPGLVVEAGVVGEEEGVAGDVGLVVGDVGPEGGALVVGDRGFEVERLDDRLEPRLVGGSWPGVEALEEDPGLVVEAGVVGEEEGVAGDVGLVVGDVGKAAHSSSATGALRSNAFDDRLEPRLVGVGAGNSVGGDLERRDGGE
nr:hypothetical protein Iba_chr08bCG4460 [Ipomoea batatas]